MCVTDLIKRATYCILHISVTNAKVNVCSDSYSVVWVRGGAASVMVCMNMVDMGKEEPPTLTGWCEWWWPDTKASSRKQIKNRTYAAWKLWLEETSVQLITRQTAVELSWRRRGKRFLPGWWKLCCLILLFYRVCFQKKKRRVVNQMWSFIERTWTEIIRAVFWMSCSDKTACVNWARGLCCTLPKPVCPAWSLHFV